MKCQGRDDVSGHPGFWGAQGHGEPTPSSAPSVCLSPLGCFKPCGTLPPEGVGSAAPKLELELGSPCSESWAGRSWRSTGGMALIQGHGGPTEPGGNGHHHGKGSAAGPAGKSQELPDRFFVSSFHEVLKGFARIKAELDIWGTRSCQDPPGRTRGAQDVQEPVDNTPRDWDLGRGRGRVKSHPLSPAIAGPTLRAPVSAGGGECPSRTTCAHLSLLTTLLEDPFCRQVVAVLSPCRDGGDTVMFSRAAPSPTGCSWVQTSRGILWHPEPRPGVSIPAVTA